VLNLGSSNYITNIAGEVSQHTVPIAIGIAFGETFVEEHKGSNNSPYKFNGKELDNESGLYYYGARYYDPRISIWASIDPLAEKFAGRSPYEYCFSDPLNLTDPTGMGPNDPPGKGWTRFFGGLKMVGGILETVAGAAGGAASSWTGVGAVVGGAVAIHGSDVASSGFMQMVTGENTSSLTSKAIQSTGVSKNTAENIDAGISILGTAGAGSIANASKATTVAESISKGEQLAINKAAGKLAEKQVTTSLISTFKNATVGEQITARFADGSAVVFDNVIVQNGKVVLINETKSGGAVLSTAQKGFFELHKAVTFVGAKAKELGILGKTITAEQTISKISRVP
jgi:RHS repeat-associated protein